MSLKVVSLEVENVKRVKRVDMQLAATGLTIVGGSNAQGKTSLLDAIRWTLGGDRYRPSVPGRDGLQAETKVTLSNGLVAQIYGKNGSLKVTDPSGKRGGITLVQDFIGTFALDLPKFLNSTAIEKCKMLLDTMPDLGNKLKALNAEYDKVYQDRLSQGRMVELKDKHAKDLPYNEGVPDALLTGTEMAEKLSVAMAVNAKNRNVRDNIVMEKSRLESAVRSVVAKTERVSELERMLAEARAQREAATADREGIEQRVKDAEAAAASLVDEDVTAVKKQMVEIDGINAKVRQNLEKQHAEEEASNLRIDYNAMSTRIEEIRAAKVALLDSAKMPLDGLSILDGELIYRGAKWDCMSGAERLKVGTAICSVIKPSCGFVLLDELEKMDIRTLAEFGEWLVEHDMQAIGTRVSDGDECSVIIEDGSVVHVNKKEAGLVLDL
jgi:hypothetical protein